MHAVLRRRKLKLASERVVESSQHFVQPPRFWSTATAATLGSHSQPIDLFAKSAMNRMFINRSILALARKNNAAGARLASSASSKVYRSAAAAVEDIKSGSTLIVGGFGLCGIPEFLIAAVKKSGPM